MSGLSVSCKASNGPVASLVAAAKALLASKDAVGALAKLDEAYALDPHDENALLTRIEVLLALNRASDANVLIKHAKASALPIRDALRAQSAGGARGGGGG